MIILVLTSRPDLQISEKPTFIVLLLVAPKIY